MRMRIHEISPSLMEYDRFENKGVLNRRLLRRKISLLVRLGILISLDQ
jgi:hypothetical protein